MSIVPTHAQCPPIHVPSQLSHVVGGHEALLPTGVLARPPVRRRLRDERDDLASLEREVIYVLLSAWSEPNLSLQPVSLLCTHPSIKVVVGLCPPRTIVSRSGLLIGVRVEPSSRSHARPCARTRAISSTRTSSSSSAEPPWRPPSPAWRRRGHMPLPRPRDIARSLERAPAREL